MAFAVAAGLLAIAAFVWLPRETQGQRAGRLLAEARILHLNGKDAEAERTAATVLEIEPESIEAAIIAAESAGTQAEFARAAGYLDPFVDALQESNEEDALRLKAILLAASIYDQRLHRLGRAEECYRAALKLAPEHREANTAFAKLLGISGRRNDAIPCVLRLVRQEQVTDLLILIARSSGAISDPAVLAAARQADPTDPNPLIGLAWQSANEEQTERAIALLGEAVQHDAGSLAAQASLGRQLLAARRFDELIRWNNRLPPEAEKSAEIWFVRGQMAEEAQQVQAAIRCYGEAVQRAPELKVANFRLAQLLAEGGHQEISGHFATRLRQLQKLEQVQDAVLFSSGHESIAPLLELIDAYEAAGRLWEAFGWTLLAIDIAPQDTAARERFARLKSAVDGLPLELTAPAAKPEFTELSSYPLPRFERAVASDAVDRGHTMPSPIHFRNDQDAVGLAFEYCNGTEGEPARRMFEFTGGGIGILDFDRDGSSDAMFTQGYRWDAPEPDREHQDQLFHNLDGRQFRSVSEAAGIVESGFGQGVTVGDFDADGFPDLYVANIGQNKLWRNNGDGTFTDISGEAGLSGNEWTTSCLMADLDGDLLPDLYDVNYVTGEDVFDRVCQHADGSPAICMPFDFDEQPDRIWRNTGDGRFVEATSELLGTQPGGKGLGIAAWDADGSGRLSVLVANDTTPCFFFTPESSAGRVRLAERGIAAGVAFNGAAKATGCMGIALGDVDRDQRLDVLITNFLAEPNTLFVNPSPGLFEDRTREQGLYGPSLDVLGFGTQFLDADLDGRVELFVANGHIDDLTRFGKPYDMPAQLFRQNGETFEPIDAATLGSYFEKKWLGRSAARVDWNRDGREDLAVGHLETPSAMLTNTTPAAGGYLSLQLTGIQSNRDAIGTTVEVRLGDQTLVRQVTAGDGYQASNERRVHFGLGKNDPVEELIVRWPSGSVQRFADVDPSKFYSLTEGRGLLAIP